MGEAGVLFPIEAWLTGSVVDPELKGPVAKARTVLREYSEEAVYGLWGLLEGLLTKGEQELDGEVPTYVPKLSVVTDPETGGEMLSDEPIPTVDRAALFMRLARQKYPRLKRLIRAVHDSMPIAFAQLLAVLILHEAAASRPEGAIRAAWAFDHIYPALHRLLEEGYAVTQSRRAGAKEGVKTRKKKANALHAEMVRRTEEHRDNGRDDHELSRLISEEFNVTRHPARRVLQNHGILSKRKRT